MDTPPAVLGIDLGTSQVKALLCARDGTVLGRGAAGYQVQLPRSGWAEADPEQWWRAVRTAVREALGQVTGGPAPAAVTGGPAPAAVTGGPARAAVTGGPARAEVTGGPARAAVTGGPARAEVTGLAAVGQMHGLILLSERSGVLRPPIIWLDRRADAEVADYQRLPADLRARLGNAPSAGMAGPLLLWLSRHEPDAYRQARWMLQPKDWLRYRLTGLRVEPATDPTDASGTLLFDLPRGTWATAVAQALGLRTDMLPNIRPPAEIAGTLLPASAEELGLPPGLPVATGAADTAASLLAAQLPPSDRWGLLTLGTGGQLIVPVTTPKPDITTSEYPSPNDSTNLFRSADGGTYRLAGAQNVGVALDWVRRTLGASWDELYGTASRPWQADTPLFLPYLAGERWDAQGAGGAWIGLTLAHQREDLLRAALEGVAFLLRGKLDDMRAAGCAPDKIRLAGGGARHPAWRQLLADVLAVPLYPAGSGSLTARGAALIAAKAIGLAGARRLDRSEDTKQPVTGASQLAEAGYRRFRSHRPT